MPSCSIEQTEAVRRYYAAFPALKKGQESPLQYYLPPPAWCRKTAPETKVKMQSEISAPKDWNSKNKKYSSGRERRNSCHGQKKNRKRFNSYRRTLESKENLPEWMTHEGVWDMEAQDPVKEFIRAIALDEGYGTCENTVTDEVKEIHQVKRVNDENMVPDFDDGLDLDTEWGALTEDPIPRVRSPLEVEQYAKFEAKFDSSIEAIWTNQQNTPDDEYQELPIDFHDLLSSPSDRLFADPSASGLPLVESIWAADAGVARPESPGDLPARLRPLNIEDEPRALEFALHDNHLDDALAAVADTMRSFAAINHSRERSHFAEVVPRRSRPPPPAAHAAAPAPASAPPPREDLLTAARTHFRPIKPARDAEPARYRDGATFAVRADLDPVEFVRSESGGAYRADTRERYLEYRTRTIDYGRLALTAEQRCPDLDDPALRLRFPVRQRDAAAQTDPPAPAAPPDQPGGAAKKMRAGDDVWAAAPPCACAAPPAARDDDELSRDWEELLAAISAAHALCASEAEADAAAGADRKRRHSAALRCAAPARCPRPHARFLRCSHRPLTR